MRTIFITCIRGLVARNILATDAFSRLAGRPGVRIVVVAADKNIPQLRREFGGSNVVFEGIALREKEIAGGRERLLWTIATNLLPSETRRVQRRVKLATDGSRLDFAVSALLGFLGRFHPVRRAFRAMWSAFVTGREFEYLFRQYDPDLLFATDIYTLEDVKLMRLARHRGVHSVGMVRSWDNVTSKTLPMHIPDRVLVNGPRIRDELARYGDVPQDRITIVGVPHYDQYRPEASTPRAEFLRQLGFDPARPLVLFATPSDHYLRDNLVSPLVVEALGESGVQVLVRPPLVGRSGLEGRALPENVRLDDPGDFGDFVNIHMSRASDRHLADSLNAADVVVTWASTMIVDAAVFGKPVILVGFDDGPRPYHTGIRRYYDYEHHRAILSSGGVRLAASPAELREWVLRYASDPALDRGGRERIIAELCGPLDGRAGERLASCLLDELGLHSV